MHIYLKRLEATWMIKLKNAFLGYSEESRAYKLYNPFTNKTIINIDVVFKQQEPWNENLDKIVHVRIPLMKEEDVVENEQQGSWEKTPNRVTLRRTLIFPEEHESSSSFADENAPNYQSSDESSNGKRKMRNWKDIYDDLDVSSNFTLLTFQPSQFEEDIVDENSVQSIDEGIESIEKNDTWYLVDLTFKIKI